MPSFHPIPCCLPNTLLHRSLLLTLPTLQEIRVWCLQTSSTLAVLTGHRASITAIHFCPNDDYLVSSAGDGNVCFWPVTGPKTVRLVQLVDCRVMSRCR